MLKTGFDIREWGIGITVSFRDSVAIITKENLSVFIWLGPFVLHFAIMARQGIKESQATDA